MKYPYISTNKCKNCGGEITIKRKRDINKEFCGTGCVGKFFKTKEKEYTNCLNCNKQFVKSSNTKNLYCSIECSNNSKRVEHIRNCEKCGKIFTCNNIAIIKRGNAIFCSHTCSSRKYNFNQNYFDNIDTPNKAYILGFLFADGNVNKKQTEMTIKLHNRDINLLEKIKLEMKSEHPIKKIIQKNKEDQVSFRISSIYLCKKLISHGVVPNKTFIIEFPELKEDLVRHFIRGYFDGDGCIHKIKNRNSFKVTIFTASKSFIKSLTEIMLKNNMKVLTYKHSNGFSMCLNKKEDINNFYNLIYQDAEIFLLRKKNKFPINNEGI
jgi:DNA-binding transcriptional regulator WhiA